MLLNERVRSINNTITIFNSQIHTCIDQLKGRIDREAMEDCYTFIKVKRERRHLKTLETKAKFNQLWQSFTGGHPNIHHGGNGDGHSNNPSKDKTTPEGKPTRHQKTYTINNGSIIYPRHL